MASNFFSPLFLPPPFLRLRLLPARIHRRPFVTAASATASSTASSSASSKSTLVIVESPTKAVTIQAILPPHFLVRSCVGHIREIPSSAKRIPAQYKPLPWARLGVDVDNDFRPIYVLIQGKQTVIRSLKNDLANSDQLILATDDDREGEAISWHLTQVLKPKVPVKRAVFHEITDDAILHSFNNCRDINLNLVEAQETRRVLDRLAGYTMSPLLWKKIARGLSAGRVQSVAMSVVVQQERKRLHFKPAVYSTLQANFLIDQRVIPATLSAIGGIRLVKGSDFLDTGLLNASATEKRLHHLTPDAIESLSNRLSSSQPIVRSVDRRKTTRNPPVPLITSTLQQECGNKLGMGAGRTMRIAQKLYENGYITYMRTDDPRLSDEAVKTCRAAVTDLYGKKALGDGSASRKAKKAKTAQAAHEAIRPAGTTFLAPEQVPGLEQDERAVYRIIFRRTLASEMASAKLSQTTVKIDIELDPESPEGKVLQFKATGTVIDSPGFLSVYQDDQNPTSSTFLPSVKVDEMLQSSEPRVLRHETKPPPRYNDASLVKVLEELGVGRPSTYAGIVEKLITRGYLYRGAMLPKDKMIPARSLVPTLTAFAVESLLSKHFPSFVNAEFTAEMEAVLDRIAAGTGERTKYLERYYCGDEGLATVVQRSESEIDASSFKQILLPNMPPALLESAQSDSDTEASTQASESDSNSEDGEIDWSTTRVLVGSYGPYVEQDGTVLASLPRSTLADDLTAEKLQQVLQMAKDPVIGTDEHTGLQLLLKTSRYGPYVQLGHDDDAPEGEKPKRCGLLPGMDIGDLTPEIASKLVSLPRLLGKNPSTGQDIRAGMGRYGPYVVHNDTFYSLRKDVHNVLTIELEQAVELIDTTEERRKIRAMKKAEKDALKESTEVSAEDTTTTKAARKKVKSSAKRKTTKKASSKAKSVAQ